MIQKKNSFKRKKNLDMDIKEGDIAKTDALLDEFMGRRLMG